MHIKTSNQVELKLGFGNYTCNWGVHICGLYENDQERDEIIMGFLGQGDLAGDLQLYCPVEHSPESFKEIYYQKFPECKCHIDNPERFNLLNAKELYYPNGTFSPFEMDKGLNEFYKNSQTKGSRNIRATAEMVWALDAIPGVEHLMVYESRLNYFIPGKPWISICMYNINKFPGSTIMKVLQTHPFTINGGIITQNPYYQDPDVWLAKNAPEFLIR
jgi:hypothetical protein